MFRRVLLILKRMSYFLIAQIYIPFNYDRKYLRGRWFEGRFNGILASGWEWVVKDAKMNRKMGTNQGVPWPVSFQCHIINPQNIEFHPDNIDNFNTFGCYFQAIGRIVIGHGTYIAPNVGIITANHDFNNLDLHQEAKEVVIGENCWLGMNSIILPGVSLGDNTIVGAGSVVTKSFMDGNCVIGGNPARIIRSRNTLI